MRKGQFQDRLQIMTDGKYLVQVDSVDNTIQIFNYGQNNIKNILKSSPAIQHILHVTTYKQGNP